MAMVTMMQMLILGLTLGLLGSDAMSSPPSSAPVRCARGLVVEVVPSGTTVERGCVRVEGESRTREGHWRVFDDGRLDNEGPFRAGRKHGLWRGFTADGKRAWTAQWKDGVEHGVWRTWYSNGKLETEITFAAGKLEGPWKSFHPNGKARDVQRYAAGVLDGKVMSRDELGRLRIEGAYRAGKRHGWWRELCPDGKPFVAARWEDGVAVEGDVTGVPPDKIPCETWR